MIELDRAVAFLEWLQPGEAWTLAALDPEADRATGTGGRPAFICSDDRVAVCSFLDKYDHLGWNIYYAPNIAAPAEFGKPRKEHVVAGFVVHADIDPPKGLTADARAQWQEKTLTRLSDSSYWASVALSFPSAIVSSGGGFQVLWRLREPLVFWYENADGTSSQDEDLIERLEEVNAAVLDLVDPANPGTHNVDRLLRLPYTTNVPSAIKRRDGREATQTWEIHGNDLHDLADFPSRALPEQTKRDVVHVTPSASVQEVLARLEHALNAGLGTRARSTTVRESNAQLLHWIRNGGPSGDRSRDGYGAACAMIRAGLSDEDVAAVLTAPELAVSGHYLDQQNTNRAVDRCIASAHDMVDGQEDERDAAKMEFAEAKLVLPSPADVVAVSKLVEDTSHLSDEQFTAALKAARKKLGARARADALYDSALLGKVIRHEVITDQTDLLKAVVAVTQYAPKTTTRDQIRAQLLPCVGRAHINELNEMIDDAMASAAANPPTFGNSRTEVEGEFVTQNGSIVASDQRNVRLAFAKLGVRFRCDKFAERHLIERGSDAHTVQDRDIVSLRDEIDRTFGFRPPKDEFYELVAAESYLNECHPVLEYLAEQEENWDGVSRVETWLIDAGAKDTPLVRAISRIVLVAAVRRVRDPGCKFDELLILEGNQGTAKSSALKILGGQWFSDDLPLGDDAQRVIERTQGKWILEAGELKGMSSKRNRDLKQFLTRTEDIARQAYGRITQIKPRAWIAIGTTNEDDYLSDPSGDRRYWPVAIVEFNLDHLASIRDQLWAEAATLESAGEKIRLDPSLYGAARNEQEERQVYNPFQDKLAAALDGVEGKLPTEEAYKIVRVDHLSARQDQNYAIGAAMKRLGWKKKQMRREKTKISCYVHGDDSKWLEWAGSSLRFRAT